MTQLPLLPPAAAKSDPWTIEEWRQIPGLEGWYDVSSAGRVRRSPLAPMTSATAIAGRILRLTPNTSGYLRCRVGLPRCKNVVCAHSMVALAFIGPRPHGMETNHIDGNKLNNRPENLEYVTRQENLRHAEVNGLQMKNKRRGLEHPRGKLTPDQVAEIRDSKEKQRDAARRFGVSQSSVWRIRHRLQQAYTKTCSVNGGAAMEWHPR